MSHIFCNDPQSLTVFYYSSSLGAQACKHTDTFSFQIFLGSHRQSSCISTCVLLMQLLKNIPVPSALLWWYLTYHIFVRQILLLITRFLWCQGNYKWMRCREVEHIGCDWSVASVSVSLVPAVHWPRDVTMACAPFLRSVKTCAEKLCVSLLTCFLWVVIF